MKNYTNAELQHLTLRELLELYVDARMQRLTELMERLNHEIDKRRLKGEVA